MCGWTGIVVEQELLVFVISVPPQMLCALTVALSVAGPQNLAGRVFTPVAVAVSPGFNVVLSKTRLAVPPGVEVSVPVIVIGTFPTLATVTVKGRSWGLTLNGTVAGGQVLVIVKSGLLQIGHAAEAWAVTVVGFGTVFAVPEAVTVSVNGPQRATPEPDGV
jgi:hypothetical protein